MESQHSARARSATSAVNTAMSALHIDGEVVLHRDNGNLVFWIGENLVAKASTGDARTELEHESAVLNGLRPLDIAVAQLYEGQSRPIVAGEWSVLFTKRLHPLPSEIKVPELLVSLRQLHHDLSAISLDVELPDWTTIVNGANQCRRTNPFSGTDATLMDKAYELVVRPAMDTSHPGQIIHGDVDLDQAISTAQGIVWIDFETTCRGPVEWDLAAFTDVTGYGDCDRQLWQQLRLVHSWCVASWCNQRDAETPTRRAARQHHLDVLTAALAGH